MHCDEAADNLAGEIVIPTHSIVKIWSANDTVKAERNVREIGKVLFFDCAAAGFVVKGECFCGVHGFIFKQLYEWYWLDGNFRDRVLGKRPADLYNYLEMQQLGFHGRHHVSVCLCPNATMWIGRYHTICPRAWRNLLGIDLDQLNSDS